jgi:two-component system sensor histidine kinase ResE
MLLQTDIWSVTAVILAGILSGAVGTWYLMHRKWSKSRSPEVKEKEALYLVFSRISHRLKTATEVIKGHLSGFSEGLPKDAERWKAARNAISEEASGVDSLTERMDLVVRLGMAEQPLVIEPVNVPRMLEDLMVELGPAADARGILLGGVVKHSAQDSIYVSGDASALREIFSNLLENAVKHNGHGTEITAEVKQEGGNLLVRISDTGKGISQKTLTNLFEKANTNYRPKTTSSTGMGLYLSRLLVELHGGNITASAIEGKGTEFHILLPLRRTGPS